MTVVAIDGPAGSGKSTIAKLVAERLGHTYLDTGAMYRTATLAVVRAGVDPTDAEAAAEVVADITIELGDRVRLGTDDVSEEIRQPAVSDLVSVVAAHSPVRAVLRRQQQEWARSGLGLVAEGRDIGTVVFPDAAVKVFLTASPEVRARRRAAEHGSVDEATIAQWADNIAERDRLDSTRADSPLVAADDATVIDTSEMTIDEVVDAIVRLAA